ncbi:MAG: hypothetical protein P1S60_00935 [Anaerolineae bacterium]|nr:hypothetical protein [Anaerolineae bacterium]
MNTKTKSKRLMFLFCITLGVLVMVQQPTRVTAAPDAPGETGEAFQVSKSDLSHGQPVVAHNTTSNQYFVVWWSRDGNDPDLKLYGQLMNDQGVPAGDAFLLSTAEGRVESPAVSYNATADEYLVVWTLIVDSKVYLVGQRLAADGTFLDNPHTLSEDESLPGVNFQITDGTYTAYYPKCAYNQFRNEYLVVWYWNVPDGIGIYGQRLASDGLPMGNSGGTGAFPVMVRYPAQDYTQLYPAVVYNTRDDEYFVVAVRQFPNGDMGDIHGKRVDGDGDLLGAVDNPGKSQPGDSIVITNAEGA